MAQPTQIIFGTANNDMIVIDNSAASTMSTLAGPNNSSPIGFDSPAGNSIVPAGSVAQASNPFANTGSTTLDVVNDNFYIDASIATFPGNPVSATAPVYKKVTTAVQNGTQGIFVKWKNPAIWILSCLLLRHMV